MIINKILNNNVVTVILNGEEAVAMGKGIGFNKRTNEKINIEEVEKIFKMDKKEDEENLKKLMLQVPGEYIGITKRIVEFAEETLNQELSELVYVILTDHIHFAVMREKEGIRIENPMLLEVKQIYKKEFEIGEKALEIIKDVTGVKLSEGEAGFIAIHILNAALHEDISNTMNITVLTNKILNIIKKHFNIEFDEESLDYSRLLTHLKFFTQRIFKREQILEDDSELYDILIDRYIEEKRCVDRIESYIKKQFKYTLTKQEIIYLIMHIRRFRN